MAKGLAPVFFTTCGVVVAGIVGYSLIEPNYTENKAPIAAVQTKPEVAVKTSPESQETAKLEVPKVDIEANVSEAVEQPADESVEKPKVIEDAPIKPTFDLVRVEKDGSTVIAGAGQANQIIELLDGDKKLAETKVNSTGEFVFVLDKPLGPGAHELFLRTNPKDGKAVLSSSFAFVDVPKPNKIGEVTVLLAESGKPSQILQKPETQAAPPNVAPKEVTEVSKPELKEVEEKPANTIVSDTAQSSVTLAKPAEVVSEQVTEEATEQNTEEISEKAVAKPAETTPAVPKPIEIAKLAPVLIEAADVEGGKIFIAGTAEPRTSINIYMGNDLLGRTKVADNGAFLFEGSKEIKSGRYDIRADMTKGGANVLARAEVTLIHEPKIVEVKKPVISEPV